MYKTLMVIGFAPLLVIAACNSSTEPSADSSSNWWPMAVGNSWTYEEDYGGGDSYSYSKTVLERGLEMPFGSNLTLVLHQGLGVDLGDSVYYENSNEYLQAWYFDEYGDSSWFFITLLDYPLSVGKIWVFSEDNNYYEGYAECVSLSETVTVPAGIFENCVKIKITEEGQSDWFIHIAPDIGFVLSSSSVGDPIEELTSYILN